MTDSIRAAAERLLKYLEANRGHDGMFSLSESQEEFNLRAALAAEPPAPAEPDTDAVLSSAPVPAAEGEREELAELLDEDGRHLVEVAFARECNKTWELARRVIRAAALLREPAQPPAPVPVPVTERPWERPGWCDAEGRCWWFNRAGIPEWQLADGGPYGDFCLPHWTIPQPQSEEVQ